MDNETRSIDCPKFGDAVTEDICRQRREIYWDVGAVKCADCEHDDSNCKIGGTDPD